MGPKDKKQVKNILIKVQLAITKEVFPIKFVRADMKISELRDKVELSTGIPYEMQKLYYLDQADLQDDTEVRHNEIVAGAQLNLEVWHVWKELIEAVFTNDIEWLARLGVTKDTEYKTPTSEYMLPKQRQQWIQNRANVALYMAASRGHMGMCEHLINWGADVNAATSLGRTALHVAAALDHGKVVNTLLTHGADIDQTDKSGNNALSIAGQYGHKACEQHLFMFRWQQRAKHLKPQYLNPPMMAFQTCDSNFPKWKVGPQAQVYVEKLLPPGEFIGSAMHAPKRSWHRRCSAPAAEHEERSDSATSRRQHVTFEDWNSEKWRAQKAERDEKVREMRAKQELEEEKRQQRRMRLENREEERQKMVFLKQAAAGEAPATGENRSGADGVQLPVLKPAQSAVDSREEIRAKLRSVLGRYEIDPELNAYQQWMNSRTLGGSRSASHAHYAMPYQEMIREFCDRKCRDNFTAHTH